MIGEISRYNKEEFLSKNIQLYSLRLKDSPGRGFNRIDFLVHKDNKDDAVELLNECLTDDPNKYNNSFKDIIGLPRIITAFETKLNNGDVDLNYEPYFFNDDSVKQYIVVETAFIGGDIICFSYIDKTANKAEMNAINGMNDYKTIKYGRENTKKYTNPVDEWWEHRGDNDDGGRNY